GPQLLNVAKEICRQNPILLLKPGKTSSGASAMSSHTGAIAQEDDILQALVSQAGIIRCQTLQTFFDFAKAFSWENLPAGPKVGIVSNAGGPAVVSADAVTAEGLELAQLDETTKKQLAEILPRAASIINPVDVLGDALADRYSQAMEVLLQKPAVDSLLVVLTPQIMTQIEKTAWVIGESAKKFHKPIFCSFMGGTAVSYGEGILNKYKIPSFRFPEEAISAISAMWRYKTIRDELNAKSETTGKLVPAGQTGKLEHVRELIQKAVNNQEHALDNLAANALITDAGISTPSTAAPKTLEAAKDFAKQNGYPVVLKLSSPKILHKGAVGGIVLDIETDEALTTAWYQLERRAAELKVSLKSEVGWQIQKAVAKGVELIVGLKQDADFGSVLLFGAGGVFAELIEDKNLHLLPIDINEAKQLVEKSKVYKVLKGANEEPPYALDKLYQLIVNLGRLGLALPEAKEIEINPVIIDLNNVWAVDAKVLLKEGAAKAKGPVKFQLAGCVNHQVLANQFNQYDFESEEPLVFQPGQYINVKVAPNTIRAYSIATRTSDRHFSLLVDTRPGGPGSHFFANLKAGDIMTYMGPFGVFTFNPNDGCRDILLLATGSGMSAIRCMIDSALMEQKLTKPLKLYFGLTHESEIFWQEHFDDLQNRFPNFSYQICLCEPDAAWSGPKGFITKLVAADYPDASNCSAYLCGHRNMIADASELLLKLGCPKSRIYTERFA
ncbi:acetate--CoA ligase family protein, partial [Patescibacteria group bacterium]|nr:acetate--CoA ligase family protein [Patescibacteria group bacterium]MBU1970538.1 acetate--CoA ligase family protein [Patescibacteria group bacterium]